MRYLETVLSFIITFTRLVARSSKKKRKPENNNCRLPNDYNPPLYPDEPDRGDTGSHRGAPGTARQETEPTNPVKLMGWCLILAASISHILSHYT